MTETTGKIIAVAIILLCAVPFPGAAGTETGRAADSSLSLSEAIKLAFKNNKDIQIQEKEIRAAKSRILGAASRMLPKINLNGSYTRNDAVLASQSDFTDLLDAKKDIGVFTGYKNDHLLGLSATDEFFNGGGDIAYLKQSRVNLRAQEETLRARKLDAEFNSKRLYYGLLLAFETERIAKDLVAQAQAHYDDVLSKFQQGTSSRFDVLQSSVHVSIQIPELVKSQRDIEMIMAELNKLIGLDIYAPVRPEDTMTYAPAKIDEEAFLKEAYLGNPEMILKTMGIDMEKWSISMARSSRLPQVSGDFNWYYRGGRIGDMFNSRHDNWYAGAAVTIPIFDSFSTKAKVDEAKARYAQAALKKEDMANQVAVDIRRGCLDVKQAEAVVDSQRDSVLQAQEALRIAGIAYDNGVGTNLDVLDAMVSLSQVEKNLASGIYDHLMAEAFLDRTRGKSAL